MRKSLMSLANAKQRKSAPLSRRFLSVLFLLSAMCGLTGTAHAQTTLNVEYPACRDFMKIRPLNCTQTPRSITSITQQPTYGTCTIGSADTIIYTPKDRNFAGTDVMVCRVRCGAATTTVTVNITMQPCPDNMSAITCIASPEAFTWGMTRAIPLNQVDVTNYPVAPELPILVGDLNGDGKPELVAFTALANNFNDNRPVDWQRVYKGIRIFNSDGSHKRTTMYKNNTPTDTIRVSREGTGVFGLVKVKLADIKTGNSTYTAPSGTVGSNVGLIVVAESDLLLYAFDIDGKQVWKSNAPYGINKFVNIGFADFNHDGRPEIHVGEKIFDAATGKLLVNLPSGGSSRAKSYTHVDLGWHYTRSVSEGGYGGAANCFATHQVAADVLGTGNLQLVYGNEIYGVKISSSAGTASNSTTYTQRAQALTSITIDKGISGKERTYSISGSGSITVKDGTVVGVPADGHVGVADFDKDGRLDVLVSNRFIQAIPEGVHQYQTYQYFYMWSPSKGTRTEPVALPVVNNGAVLSYKNIPMIGDIDGDGVPEVILIAGTNDRNKQELRAYKYASGAFTEKWSIPINDNSASTGLTLFDFNQDGVMEIVYRDGTNLRIINGSGNTATDLIPPGVPGNRNPESICGSGTGTEFPVIADVDGDGHAEIVVAGHPSITPDGGQSVAVAGVMIFKGAPGGEWAPARPVWNQYSYTSVNVNADLTIPAYQTNSAYIYGGDCKQDEPGEPRYGGKVQPYNGYMQQQPLLNQYGCPLWMVPSIEWVPGKEPKITVTGETLTFSGTFINNGEETLNNPVYITFYKNEATVGNILATISSSNSVAPGATSVLSGSIVIPAASLYGPNPVRKVIVSINDNAGDYPHQRECVMNGRIAVDFPLKTDNATAPNCAATELDVLASKVVSCASSITTSVTILTPPTRGSAVAGANGKIMYIPSSSVFVGRDSVLYEVFCNNVSAGIVQMYISVVECPDNIFSTSCPGTPPATTWGIQKRYTSKQAVYDADVPLVGDVDNDGQTEIICATWSNDYSSDSIIVFNGATGAVKKKFKTILFNPSIGSRAIAKIGTKTYIFVAQFAKTTTTATVSAFIYRYELSATNPATTQFQFPEAYYTGSCQQTAPSILLTDFNGDGTPELMVRDKVYNAATGALLLNGSGIIDTYGTGGGHPTDFSTICASSQNAWTYGTFPVAADMDNDGLPELVAGTKIYKINITNSVGTSSNSCSLLRQVNSSATGIGDGFTSVADINLDGYLDVVVSRNVGTRTKYVYAWNGKDGALLGMMTITETNPTGESLPNYYGPSIPFIGDLNGDGKPEIAFSSYKRLHAYEYKSGSFTALAGWPKETSDGSAATTLTLFDFNQDGKVELIYRDETDLRIIDGATGENRTTFPCFSSTISEYPIVADVTGDGYANIVVLGKNTKTGGNKGYMHVYANSAVGAWAPARKVWNQWAYNAVNVNEDLTIPKGYFHPATAFPGACPPSSAAPHRPYNAFLQQQTMLDTLGCPLWALPDIRWVQTPTATVDGTSATFTGTIKNVGDAGLQDPIYVTFYKNDTLTATTTPPGQGSIIKLDSITVSLPPQGSYTFKFVLTGLTPPITRVWISVNDKNGIYPYQQECMMDSRRAVPLSTIFTDHAQVLTCYPSTDIDVLASGLFACAPASTSISIVSGTEWQTMGAATDAGNGKIKYTLKNLTDTGRDSILYEVRCNGASIGTAKMYINVVPCPDNIDTAKCVGEPEGFEWAIKPDFIGNETDVHTYITPMVADLDGDGIPEILAAKWYERPESDRSNIYWQDIYVYWGTDRENPTVIPTQHAWYFTYGFSVAKAKINGQYKPIVVMVDYYNYLYAYTPGNASQTEVAAQLWKSDYRVMSDYIYDNSAQYAISFADFDNDGEVEIYVGNRIFDAATGKLLVEGPADGNKGKVTQRMNNSYCTFAADVDGDGRLELVAGTEVYKVTINRATPSASTMTLMASIPPVDLGNGDAIKDGYTTVADINRDGHLDVVVVANFYQNVNVDGYAALMAWDVKNKTLIGKGVGPTITTNYRSHVGVPFIGDVDKDGKLEILFVTGDNSQTVDNTNSAINGFRWDGNQTFEKVYSVATTDRSGMTGITLFDFNQDGEVELVYRDETDLRIMHADPASGTFKNLKTLPCGAGTGSEYPVIADVDNDGSAEIVTIGGAIEVPSHTEKGSLQIYKSGNEFAWAPARKVWNQYAYNVVNVNEDLTIPRYQMNPATFFAGEDEIMGNGHDIQPYNAFLQQQTMLNKFGEPLFLLPNIVWAQKPTAAVSGSSVTFTGTIKNIGDAGLQNPIYVTFYRNDTIVPPGSIIKLDSITANLLPGASYTFSFTLDRLDTLQPLSKVFISVNDKNGKYTYQQQCEVDGRWFALMTPEFDQAGTMTACVTAVVPKEFDVFTPDVLTLLGCAIGDVSVSGASSLRPAELSFTNDKKLSYKPLVTVAGTYKDTVTINAVDTENNQAFTVLLEVEVTLTDPPAPTLTTTSYTFCDVDKKTVSNLSTDGGTAVKWYNEFDELLAGSEILKTGAYYASQTAEGCESSARTEVTVTINACTFEIIIPDDCATNPRLQVVPQYPGATYDWYRDGVKVFTGAEFKLDENAGGEYQVKIDDYLGAARESATVKISITVKTMQGGRKWYEVQVL